MREQSIWAIGMAVVIALVGDAKNPKPRPVDEVQRQMASTT